MELYKQIQDAKQLLKENGYHIDNMWTVGDVQGRYECDDETAQAVLDKALNNEGTQEQIWSAISQMSEDIFGLTKLEE